MTHTELELCARFLGEPYYVGGEWLFRKGETMYALNLPSQHGALLLALLERAMNLKVDVHVGCRADSAQCQAGLSKYSVTGPTPLSAMTAAVAKYMENQP